VSKNLESNEKLSEILNLLLTPSSLLLTGKGMDAALQLVAAPAATARVGTGGGDRRARLAADAGIAQLIE
jgi:hypothetical protein